MLHKRIDNFIKNPKKALFTLAFPILIAMVVQVMYNIVDTAFVGRLGANAIAALTFAFPLFFILIALNSGIGVGMGSRISRLLGAKDKKEAENTTIHGIIITVFISILIFVLGTIFIKPLFSVFGATPEVLDLGVGYMKIIFLGIFAMFTTYILNNIFVAQGDTKTPMKIQTSALILNIILDPIFIYILGLGVRGAAIATVISFTLAFVLSVYFISKKSYLKVHLSSFKFSARTIKEIFFIGLPASLTMFLMSMYIIFINRFMSIFGTDYVASVGIVSRLDSVVVMPIIAFSVAMITLVGMFYGAKRFDLLKGIIWFALKITVSFSIMMGLLFFLFPSVFLRIFTSNIILLNISSVYLKIYVVSFPLMAISIIINRSMQGMGTGIPGLVTNLVRIFIIAVPLSYLFIIVLKFSYLWVAFSMVLGAMASAIISFIWLEIKLKKINSKV